MREVEWRVDRGGSWFNDPSLARLDRPDVFDPAPGNELGFRIARLRSPLDRLAEAGWEVNREKG